MDPKDMTTPMASGPEAIKWCFIRSSLFYDVSSDDWVFEVPNEHKNIYLLCCEYIEPVSDRSETCSLDWCKAHSEVPKGYSWLWAQVWGESKYWPRMLCGFKFGQIVLLIRRALRGVASIWDKVWSLGLVGSNPMWHKAEYVAACSASCEAVWLRKLLSDLFDI